MKLPEPIPTRIAQLPVCPARKIPVPWFVAWLDADNNPVPAGQGTPEFRVTKPAAALEAHKFGLCWVCGQRLGSHKAFLIGPMCAVSRNTIDAPSHVECAEWSARACPFLLRPHMERRTGNLPPAADAAAGMISRNPGVMLLWVVRRYRLRAIDRQNGVAYFDIGDPDRVAWYRMGREATRDEVLDALASGMPILRAPAEAQGPVSVRKLDRARSEVNEILPA